MPDEEMKKPYGEGLFDYFFWWIKCGARKIFHAIICSMPPHPPQGVQPTAEEEKETLTSFPNLKTWSVTGPENNSYNCIAWSVGITDQWLWPEPGTVKVFDAFYASYGWSVSSNNNREYKKRKIALYALNGDPDDCRHGSRETHDCGWHESKQGEWIRIMHIKEELEGGRYGSIIRSYEKPDENANLDLC